MIARRYLRSWFVIDVLSILPVEELIEWSLNTLDRSNLDFLKMVRMLRLLRLIKLMRILRASRILKRWEGVVPISYAHWELFKWISIVVLTTHWLACSLGLLAQLADDQRTDALAAGVLARVLAGEPADEDGGDCFGCVRGDTRYEAFCEFTSCLTSCEVDVLARMELGSEPFLEQVIKKRNAIRNAQTWICRYNDEGSVRNVDYHGDVWLAAMYVSTVAMTGGVGSIVPENRAEYAVFCFAILIGSIIWAMVVGTICAMMTTGDPHTIAFRQQMDALNDFIADMKIPHELGVLARSYLRNTRELRKKLSYDSLVSRLSPGLQGAMMPHVALDIHACMVPSWRRVRVPREARGAAGAHWLPSQGADQLVEPHNHDERHRGAWRRSLALGLHLGRRHDPFRQGAARHTPRDRAHVR
jgi:hypothetical protein